MGGKRSWRAMTRDFAREFPHQVRLTHAGLWRDFHTGHAVQHLDVRAYRRWTEGDVFVFGFKSAWSEACGIDWSIAADEQARRPPNPPRRPIYGEPSPGGRGWQGN